MNIILDEKDKNLGILVNLLVVLVMGAAVVIHCYFGAEWAVSLGMAAFGWWFGATMVWLWEKHYRYFRHKDS